MYPSSSKHDLILKRKGHLEIVMMKTIQIVMCAAVFLHISAKCLLF